MRTRPGAAGSASLVVAEADTAPAAGSGEVPVLATPRLLALCEQATLAAVAPFLTEGETTVGSRVELAHLAPSPPGASVEAAAVLVGIDGNRLTFLVTARQGDRVVGRGTIERVVVDRARFMARVARSTDEPAGSEGPDLRET